MVWYILEWCSRCANRPVLNGCKNCVFTIVVDLRSGLCKWVTYTEQGYITCERKYDVGGLPIIRDKQMVDWCGRPDHKEMEFQSYHMRQKT